jgi:Leucine-rich repeat (LRR) protein
MPAYTTAAQKFTLIDGSSIEGEKISENLNFITVDISGSQIQILKSRISSISGINTDINVNTNTASNTESVADTNKTHSEDNAEQPVPPEILSGILKESKKHTERPLSWEELLRMSDTIQTVDFSFHEMEKLPFSITRFKKIKSLDLKGNRLVIIPDDIGDLTSLEHLDLSRNRICSLPLAISNLTGLKKLQISGNRISESEIFHLKRALPYTEIICDTKNRRSSNGVSR